MSTNGSHVTWRELNLALDPIKDDVAEIKADVKAVRDAATTSSWLGVRGHNLVNTVVSGVILALASTAISLLILHVS